MNNYVDKAFRYIDENYAENIDILKRLIELPTVLAINMEELVECVRLLSLLLKDRGLKLRW